MSSEVGSGHVSIFPVMTGFKGKVSKETQSAGVAGAKSFEGGFKGAGTKAGRSLGRDLKAAVSATAGDLGAAETKKLTSEVASASAALAKVRLKQQDDAGRVRVAETQLAEAIAKSGAESSRAVAAEERLAAARRVHAATTTSVAAASTRLKGSQDALQKATDAASAATERSGKRFAGFRAAAASGFSGLRSAASSGFSAVVGMARSAASSVAAALSSGFRTAQTASAVALGAITLKLGSLVPGAVTASDAIDKFKSTLNFAGIDTAQIDALTKSTQAYADRTVYDLADIQSVTAQLAANGVKDYDKLAEAGGNLNAVAGGNAETFKSVGMVLTQTAGQGKLTTENWNQLADAIPGASGKLQQALAEAGAYTGNFREAMEKGEISAEEFNKAILGLGLTDVARDAATATSTFEGAAGGLKAAITGGIVKVLAPLKPLITGTLTAAAGAFTSFFDKVATGLTAVVDLLGKGDFTAAFRETFGVAEDSPVVDFLLKARDAVMGFSSVIPNLLAVVGPMIAALGIGGLGGVLASFGPLASLLPGLGGALSLLGGPLGVVAAGLAGLVLSGGNVGDIVVGLTSVVVSVTSALPGLVSQVASFVPQIVTSILAQVPSLLAAGAEIITVLVQGLVTAIPAIASGATMLVTGLLNAIIAALPTIIQGASQLVTALIQGIVTAVPLLVAGAVQLVTGLLNAIVAALPMLITGAIQLVTTLVTGLVGAIPLLITAALTLVTGLLTAIVGALPQIIQGGIKLLLALVMGIIQALPQLLTAALGLVMGLLGAIIDNLPMIIDAGIQLLLSLVTGLIAALPDLITAAITLVLQLVVGLITMLPKLVEAGITLVVSLITGLVEAIPQLIEAMPQIVKAIWDGLAGVDWLSLGMQIIQGIIDGFASMGETLASSLGDLVGGVLDFFPHSPAKRGPFSNAGGGWRQLKSSGAATMGQFIDGAAAQAPAFGDTLAAAAEAASQRAQVTVGTAATAMAAGRPGTGGRPPGSEGESAGFTQNNYFDHMDPEVGIEAAGQRAARIARRAGI